MITKIREYIEESVVEIKEWWVTGEKRLVIEATSEDGNYGTNIDLLDVIEWVRNNKPELLKGE